MTGLLKFSFGDRFPVNLLALLEGGRDSGTANKRSKGILHKLMYVGIAYHGLIIAGLYPGITQMLPSGLRSLG